MRLSLDESKGQISRALRLPTSQSFTCSPDITGTLKSIHRVGQPGSFKPSKKTETQGTQGRERGARPVSNWLGGRCNL